MFAAAIFVGYALAYALLEWGRMSGARGKRCVASDTENALLGRLGYLREEVPLAQPVGLCLRFLQLRGR